MEYRESRVRLDSEIRIDQYGIMTAKARIARIGVQHYMVDGKLLRELRSEEEVKKSVDTFNNKPVTLNHPSIRVVTSKNAQNEMKGFVTDLSYDEGWVVANIHITHQDAIQAAQSTHTKFSNGYKADLDKLSSPGLWTDEYGVMGEKGQVYEYDAIQVGIEGNHVALVRSPRAGSGATFIDEDDVNEVITIDSNEQNENKINPMPTKETENNSPQIVKVHNITIGDSNFEISGDDASKVIAAVASLSGQLDGAKLKLDEANDKISTLENTKLDENLISAEVSARTAIWGQVATHLDSEIDYSLPVIEVKKLFLKSVAPNLATKIDSANESYVEGLWDVKQPVDATPEDTSKKILDSMDNQAPGGKVAKNDSLSELQEALNTARANYFK